MQAVHKIIVASTAVRRRACAFIMKSNPTSEFTGASVGTQAEVQETSNESTESSLRCNELLAVPPEIQLIELETRNSKQICLATYPDGGSDCLVFDGNVSQADKMTFADTLWCERVSLGLSQRYLEGLSRRR